MREDAPSAQQDTILKSLLALDQASPIPWVPKCILGEHYRGKVSVSRALRGLERRRLVALSKTLPSRPNLTTFVTLTNAGRARARLLVTLAIEHDLRERQD